MSLLTLCASGGLIVQMGGLVGFFIIEQLQRQAGFHFRDNA
jgi:hypothetical protein